MLEKILSEERIEFVHQILYYSDLTPEQYQSVFDKVQVALLTHFFIFKCINDHEIYDIATRKILRIEKTRNDAMGFPLYFGKPIRDGEKTTFYHYLLDDEIPDGEDTELVTTRRMKAFDEALSFLSKRLTFREQAYLIEVINTDYESALRNFVLTPEYVRENFEVIRQQLQLAMKLYPELAETRRVHALSMDKALIPYVLEVYKEILLGTKKQFPRNFFSEEGKRKTKIMAGYLLEDVLEIPVDNIPKVVSKRFIQRHKLGSACVTAFRGSPFGLITEVYPQQFKPWEFKSTPNNYWSGKKGKENGIKAVKWLFEEKLGIEIQEIPSHAEYSFFRKHKLDGMLNFCFDASPYNAVNAAYPGMFRPWEFYAVPRGYWVGENGRKHAEEATKWLVEEKLKLDVEDIPSSLKAKDFVDNGLHKVIYLVFSSVYEAVNSVYPGRFKPEQLTSPYSNKK